MRQHNSVVGRKLGRDDFDEEDEEAKAKETDIERAYMFGACLAAMHAFSLKAEDIDLFRLKLMSHYHGWSDVAAIDQELSYMHEASGTYEHISDAGFERMLLFLTGGKVEQNAFDLAGRMGY